MLGTSIFISLMCVVCSAAVMLIVEMKNKDFIDDDNDDFLGI